MFEEEAAGDRAEGDGQAAQRRPDADRLAPFLRGEGVIDHRERGRRHDRTGHTHDTAPDDEFPGGVGEAGECGRYAEDDQPDHQNAATAEGVGEDAGGKHQGRVEQDVGVQGPLELRVGRADILLDRLQSDIQDGVVHHHHQETAAEDGHDQSAATHGCAPG
ncbi:hypothetical protein QF026_001487 [Streptomyces aurantiacus]|nr:hypothetical protein [Streptomyces aurantiacus]MDQ0773021.1 hypothetical protein [Streptomyces aurantiacus]